MQDIAEETKMDLPPYEIQLVLSDETKTDLSNEPNSPMYDPLAPDMAPPPQMQQPPQSQLPIFQQVMPPPQQPSQYRQTIPPSSQRGPALRQPMAPGQKAPMMKPRGAVIATATRVPRPTIIKRTPEPIQSLQARRKTVDVLVPDKNDDADCQVIAMQPKNIDGGLPQIQSVQGGTSDPTDNVLYLSDSRKLSVRNLPPRKQIPKKSDAKEVANILATRGVTVTATPKSKQKALPTKEAAQAPSVGINLNSAVSIIPTAKKTSNKSTKSANASPEQKKNQRRTPLLFRCDLCLAQYPTAAELEKHQRSYHRTDSQREIGIPLIDLKQPGIVQKLIGLGIYNFIPLSGATSDENYAVPVVSVNVPRAPSICNLKALGASSILKLGPVRPLFKPQMNNNVPANKE